MGITRPGGSLWEGDIVMVLWGRVLAGGTGDFGGGLDGWGCWGLWVGIPGVVGVPEGESLGQ